MASMGYITGGFIGFLTGAILGMYFYGDGDLWTVALFVVIYVSGYMVMKAVENAESI
jgi:hypothetical protein